MTQSKPQPPPGTAPSGSVQIWADTHPGKEREANEDNVYPRAGASRGPIRVGAAKLEAQGRLAIVADGVGGAQVGARISERAVQYVSDGYYDGQHPDPGVDLKQAVESANHWLHDLIRRDPAYSRAATTLTAAVVRGDTLRVAHVGDSRAYLIRSGQISQLTKDHTVAQEKFDAGYIRREEIPGDPGHSVLTRSLGSNPQVQVDLHRQTLTPGDVVLLCSDGLYDELDDEAIRAVAERESPKKAVKTLIKRANRAGGQDNISVAIMRLAGGPPAGGWAAWQRAALLLLATAVVAMIAILGLIVARSVLDGEPTPPAVAIAPGPATPAAGDTASPGATQVAVASPPPGAPTASREPTSTPIQFTEPAPTDTPKPTKPSGGGREATQTPRPPQPSATPKPNPQSPPAPALRQPDPGATLNGKPRFEWQWNHPALAEGRAFDLLIWAEKEKELDRSRWRGAITPWRETWAEVEIGDLATVREHGEGTYYWTVIVVQKEPYKRIGRWGEFRTFIYQVPVPLATRPPPTNTPKTPPANTLPPPPTKPPQVTATSTP